MTFAAPDPYTVTVTLDKPLSTALFYPRVANYAGGYILCRKAAEKLGPDGLKTHPVGTGPFMFKDYSPRKRWTWLPTTPISAASRSWTASSIATWPT